jgi:pimeloyl-ACP methyl ester carboxylesterase
VKIEEKQVDLLGERIFCKSWVYDLKSSWIILLHDALGSVAQWKSFPELLCKETQCNVLAFDRVGYGQSSGSVVPRPINFMHIEANLWMLSLMKALNIINPIIIGHSDGASIALMYANHSNCKGLVSIAAHVVVEDLTVKSITAAATQKQDWVKGLNKYHGNRAEEIFDAWNKLWVTPEFKEWNIQDEIDLNNLPTLLIQGSKDEYGTWDQINSIAQKANTIEEVKLEGIGHMPHLEDPLKLVKVISPFVGKVIQETM